MHYITASTIKLRHVKGADSHADTRKTSAQIRNTHSRWHCSSTTAMDRTSIENLRNSVPYSPRKQVTLPHRSGIIPEQGEVPEKDGQNDFLTKPAQWLLGTLPVQT
jgi:hypothetical protein